MSFNVITRMLKNRLLLTILMTPNDTHWFLIGTCLHWACMKKAPLSVIQLLLLEYVDALLQVDAFGQTPIHSAVEHCSQEVISIMLKKKKKNTIKSSSSSFEKNKSGSIPPLTLALLCERNPTIIKLLLLHDPMQVRFVEDKENQNGVVPIEIFFRRHLRNIIGYSHNIDPVTGFSNLVVSHDTVIQDIYMIASYMLQAVKYTEPLMVQTDNHHNQKRKKDFVIVDSWNILPVAIECPQCPHQFVDLILRLHPEQATYLDKNKKPPLHLACSLTSKSTSVYNTTNNIQFEMNDATNDEDSKTNDDKMTACIKSLVKSNPELTKQVDGEGNYPLHIALKAGKAWEDGINDLVLGYPNALFILDCTEKLYPFMMAAAATKVNMPVVTDDNHPNVSSTNKSMDTKEEDVSLTTTFNLLRLCPDILQNKYMMNITVETNEKVDNDDNDDEEFNKKQQNKCVSKQEVDKQLKESPIMSEIQTKKELENGKKIPMDVSTNNNESHMSEM